MRQPALIRAAFAATAVVALAIGVLTMLPISVQGPPGGDKLHHLAAFGALVLPLAAVRPRWTPILLVFAVAYGGIIDLVQPLVGRDGEWADFMADAAGAVAGAAAGLALAALARRRKAAD